VNFGFPELDPGHYRHHKGGDYTVLFVGHNSTNKDVDRPMVCYVPWGKNVVALDVLFATRAKRTREDSKPAYRVPSMAEIAALPWNGFTVASTFSGCGGLSLGYKLAGFLAVKR
jgi:hypothetical protein